VFRDVETFSSRSTSIPSAGWPRPLMPVEVDPPDHGRYRALLARCLTGSAGTAIAKALEAECVRLVDRIAPTGACDLVADYARPLQNALFAALFDVPEEQTQDCARWAADLLQDSDRPRRRRSVAEFMSYVEERVAECAARSTDQGTGLLDPLARTEVDGRPLTREESLDLAFLMGMASLDTLTNSISFSFRYLADHPEHQRRLVTGTAAGAAAEELLRLHSVVTVARTATRDTEVAGVRIREGERVLLSLSLADRDPDVYPDPTTADFDRANRGAHLAFGFGPHRCLGARIATQGLTAALREWHRAIPEYAITEGADLRTGGGAVCTLRALPLSWQA
jgi:cytochrome P450